MNENWVNSGYLNATKLGASNFWVAGYHYGFYNHISGLPPHTYDTTYGAWQFSSQMYVGKAGPLDATMDYGNIFYVAPLTFVKLAAPTYFVVTKSGTHTVNLSTKKATSTALSVGTQVRVADKITISNVTYYRTSSDDAVNRYLGIPASDLGNIAFTTLKSPKTMQVAATDVYKINVDTGSKASSSALTKNQQVNFADQITVGGVTYLRTTADKAANHRVGIPLKSLVKVPFSSMTAQWLQVASAGVYKINLDTGVKIGSSALTKAQQIQFADKITINGISYLRTAADKKAGHRYGILASKIGGIPFTKLPKSVTKKVNGTAVYKVNVSTGAKIGAALKNKQAITFVDKCVVNGKTYLRTTYDKAHNLRYGVLQANLK